MSETVKADLMMSFRDEVGRVVWAESTLDVDKGDSFLKDYKTAPNADYFSSFFEVKSFNFAMAVKDIDNNDQKFANSQQQAGKPAKQTSAMEEFGHWRSAEDEELRKLHFPVEFNNFSFTRVLDAASTTFFTACCNSTRFYSAALVKRVSVGSSSSAVTKARGYLRFDFRDVMLTSVNWDDGELVTENCSFICRAMRLRYKQQRSDGSLMPVMSETIWPHNTRDNPINDSKLLTIVQELFTDA